MKKLSFALIVLASKASAQPMPTPPTLVPPAGASQLRENLSNSPGLIEPLGQAKNISPYPVQPPTTFQPYPVMPQRCVGCR